MNLNQTFKKALDTASKVANARNAIPALDCFLVKGNTITVSDLNTFLSVNFEGEPFDALLSINDVRKGLAYVNGDFSLEIANNIAKFKDGSFEFTTSAFDVSDYPTIPTVEGEEEQVSNLSLTQAIPFSEMNEDMAFSGLLIDGMGEYINVVAATHKSMYVNTVEGKFTQKVKINAKAAKVINNNQDITISSDSKNSKFVFGNVTLITRNSNLPFPNYKMIIPSDNTKLNVNVLDLLMACQKVCFANEAFIDLNVLPNSIEVTSCDIDLGKSAKDTVKSDGNPVMSIKFSSPTLVQALKACPDGTLSIKAPDRVAMVESETTKIIVMPCSF